MSVNRLYRKWGQFRLLLVFPEGLDLSRFGIQVSIDRLCGEERVGVSGEMRVGGDGEIDMFLYFALTHTYLPSTLTHLYTHTHIHIHSPLA